jgi:streptogramin lyase
VKTVLRHKKDVPNSLKDDVVWSLLKDRQGNIWVATNKGVSLYNRSTQTFTHYPTFFQNQICYWLKEDADGDLWMGGDDELVIYNPKNQALTRYNERTRDFIPTAQNRYWLATRGHGLALFDKEQGAISYLTESDGLCNNNIQSLNRDANGQIWISTFNGLSQFDENKQKFTNFDVDDGLQSKQFNYGAALVHNNNLIYGGMNGINIFNPTEIRKNTFTAPVVFTGLRIFNIPVKIGEKPLKKSISRMDKIELSSRQDVFSIEFAALSYAKSRHNEYAYMLEGFDKGWIYSGTGGVHSATYTNLNSGKYVFRVKTADDTNAWEPQEARLEIIIHPPFWKTVWFRLIAISALILFVIYIVRFYWNRAKLNNELMFEKTRARKLHESEDMKLRFFTNISH